MIELDTELLRRETIELAGANPIGEREGLVWFTDLITKTTLVLEPQDVTLTNVRKKLEEARKRFEQKNDAPHEAG